MPIMAAISILSMLIAGDGAEGGIPAIGAAAGIAAPPIPIILSIMGIIISIMGIPIPPAGMGAAGIPAMGAGAAPMPIILSIIPIIFSIIGIIPAIAGGVAPMPGIAVAGFILPIPIEGGIAEGIGMAIGAGATGTGMTAPAGAPAANAACS